MSGSAAGCRRADLPETAKLEPRARKRFGQHFLHDPGVIERIVDALNPAPGDTVIEIGPGRGALTGPLLDRVDALHVVEVDRDLAGALPERVAGRRGELVVHAEDALAFSFAALSPGPGRSRIIGNLPYNISTPLLFHLLGQREGIRDMHFMLQKEVVGRLTACPGTSAYGRLSVMAGLHCRAERLFEIGPGAFSPPPKVTSALVRLTMRERPAADVRDFGIFKETVARAFGRRRKTLRNALSGFAMPEDFVRAGVDPGLRAEVLGLEELAALANACAARRL